MSDLEMALAYCKMLLLMAELDADAAHGDAQGFCYCIRDWPKNFDRKATEINLRVWTELYESMKTTAEPKIELDAEEHKKTWDQLRGFVIRQSREEGISWISGRASEANHRLGCDHYWLVRRGGVCERCKKIFEAPFNGRSSGNYKS